MQFFKQRGVENSWFINRMPLYLWLGLIIERYGHAIGLEKCALILNMLSQYRQDTMIPSFSEILNLDVKEQEGFWDNCLNIIDKDVLSPLTVLYTYSDAPVFSIKMLSARDDIGIRMDKILHIMNELSDHQSNLSTDIRYLVIYALSLNNRLHVAQGLTIADALREYPHLEHTDERMRIYRSSIRAMEIGLGVMDANFSDYLNDFWIKVSIMTECDLMYIDYEIESLNENYYSEIVSEVFSYYSNLFTSVSPLDNKMLVLLGLSTYSYKRLYEIVANNIANTITARSTVRVLVECYIMMKYLLLLEKEQAHNDVWQEFQYYGIGQYKLIFERFNEFYSDKDMKKSHVDFRYIDLIVRDYKIKEFIEMDTSYFDKKGIRDKAIAVDEKTLYDLYYDYDSAFEHGLWGAIRESALLKCSNPAHQYHLVPDSKIEQQMKSVWSDCVQIMNRIIALLIGLYGLPVSLREELKKYGI